jgi:6-phosphogluconolactonase
MSEIRTYDNPDSVAAAAAENAVEILQLAIENNGHASWVLAGGTSPLLAYKKLVAEYGDALDWSKVTILIGDERMVPFTHEDSNWGTITKLFDKSSELSKVTRIAPDTSLSVEDAAAHYANEIGQVGITRFDLVWIGVGEDGHTLSLFPGNPGFTQPTTEWAIPVTDSPKPPSERISLSLTAMQHGVVVAETVEAHGGEVRWLYDDAAWGEK